VSSKALPRPDLLAEGAELLSPMERLQTATVRFSFDSKPVSQGLRFLQRTVGTRWIGAATSNLQHIHHFERLSALGVEQSFILACNHRSLFDMYPIVAYLLRRGLRQRIVFPVRSKFFYDNPLGLVINGAMSFFAMYPPIFRDRARAQLNLSGLQELAWLLRSGGTLVGFHPEGTRNTGNPYALLPARSGIGRLVHMARVPVVPVFTNGLENSDLKRQIRGNFDGTGIAVHTVFGAPIDFGSLLEEPGSQSVFKRIANVTRCAIERLAHEEVEYRQRAGHAFVPGSDPSVLKAPSA
jgi:1-acyl-sn-glycerol-3-phosphate acyltransferase